MVVLIDYKIILNNINNYIINNKIDKFINF